MLVYTCFVCCYQGGKRLLNLFFTVTIHVVVVWYSFNSNRRKQSFDFISPSNLVYQKFVETFCEFLNLDQKENSEELVQMLFKCAQKSSLDLTQKNLCFLSLWQIIFASSENDFSTLRCVCRIFISLTYFFAPALNNISRVSK